MPRYVVTLRRVVTIERAVEASSAAEARRIAGEDAHDFALDGNPVLDDTKIVNVKPARDVPGYEG